MALTLEKELGDLNSCIPMSHSQSWASLFYKTQRCSGHGKNLGGWYKTDLTLKVGEIFSLHPSHLK